MEVYPAMIVHGLADAVTALAQGRAEGRAVTLLSAPGAALFAGCGWWRALVDTARAGHPEVACIDILDCADATGQAFAALRIGLCRLVLWPEAPGRNAVVAIAESMGGFVLAAAPAVNPPVNFARLKQSVGATSHGGGAEPDHPLANGDKRPAPG